ncbi:hypothetical protein GCM10027168_01140 [Streptomyces capparidis]
MSYLSQTRPGQFVASALALTALVAGSGCGAFDTPESRPCAWLDHGSDEVHAPQPQTAVLVDRSFSARPNRTTAEDTRVPDWASTLLSSQWLSLSLLEGRSLSIAGFDGTRATVDWTVDHAPVKPVEGNDTLKKDRRNARADCLDKQLRRTSTTSPAADRTDVLGALAAAADQLASGGSRRVLVATDGLTNTGCADLRSAGFDGDEEIKAVVNRCHEAGELPDLTGAEVNLVGIGRSASGKAPSSPQTAWLVRLWSRLCEATGALSCKVAPSAKMKAAGRNTPAGKPEPEVSFPAVSERPTGRVTTITLPGSVLFDTDRAELTSAATSALDDAARRIEELDAVSVAVSGHTDSRGTEQRGRHLSLARAHAVRSALAQRGIPVASVRGYSDDRPSCSPEYREGIPDYAAMACNRRVEIAVAVRG